MGVERAPQLAPEGSCGLLTPNGGLERTQPPSDVGARSLDLTPRHGLRTSNRAGEADDTPQRIQRRRIRYWRMPKGAVYVGRPSRWGNTWDFNPKSETSRRVAVAHFRHWLDALLQHDSEYTRRYLAPLRGHDLACWCPLDKPCHADVLLEVAN